MNGIDLFLLGRALMRIGEAALPAVPQDATAPVKGTRAVLIVASDVAEHQQSSVSEIAQRTGLPQSQVSTAVARLEEAGSVVTSADPSDRRRKLVERAPGVSQRMAEVRTTSITAELTAALGETDPLRVRRVTTLLEELGRELLPDRDI